MPRPGTDLRLARRRARALVRELQLPCGAELSDAVSAVSRARGVQIVTAAADIGAGVWGLSALRDQRVHVFWDRHGVLSDQHRSVIVAHELGHIMAGHLDNGTVARRCRELDLVDDEDEFLAEAFAGILIAELLRLRPLATRLDELN